MAKGKRVKKPVANKGGRVTASEPPNYDDKSPIFSLERLQSGDYCLSVLERDDKAAFAMAMFRRKNMTWKQIKQADRHGLGTEKIPRNAIKAPIPSFVTEDVKNFLALRFSGTKPMVGYRNKDVFFVLWFDGDYTLYDHS